MNLPATILVRLTVDNMGGVELRPVSPRVEKLIGATNKYDGSGIAYFQNPILPDLADQLPATATYRDQGKRRWNNGARFKMDSWTFRHLVGGQPD